ncbi:peptide/nickel transport system substrate-binding protein [Microbacterium foliorum]|uniref:Peptide/nickel transport system substrate-binding protein n=1 Tax=Microbacterium foliorum TaxID=104336 RepID=A0ABU1HVH9_9MICO|nr:ABC transporter substrate-binding protein [Microbacterium foliorum]MDR6144065.1 peptide/nickel transport system substrate-binding protein [Microbacterium foliorum]
MNLLRRSARPAGAALAVIALAVSLAACAPPDRGGSGGEAAPQEGGTLRIAAPGSANDSVDPHINSGSVIDLLRTEQLFDNLTKYDENFELTWQLAESMEANETNDVWTIHLRDGVKFHDGSDFGADDVIASLDRILAPDSTANGASLVSFIDPAGLTAVDDLTVEVRLAEPYGPFPELWTNKYLRIAPAEFDPQNPVGTGPFEYKSFTPGTTSVFTRNEDYWAGAPLVDELEIVDFADNASAINALKGGQIDVTYSVPLSEAATVAEVPGLNLLDSETNMYIPITMRTDVAPFDDPRVREAFKLIADREELVAVALNGYGAVANDYIGRYSVCEAPDLPQREQDIERAKELLSDAGYADLSVEIATTNGTVGMVEAAQVFSEQAKAAGVTITVNNMDASVFLDNYKNWPLSVDFYTDSYLQVANRTLSTGGGSNVTHWSNAEFDGLLRSAMEESDVDARCQIENEMKTIEYNDSGNIVWGWANVVNAYSDNVHGLVPNATGKAVNQLTEVWVDQ